MKVVDISTEIFIEIGSPTTTSVPAIAFWVRSKLGWLNATLYEDFFLDANSEVLNAYRDNSEISLEAVAVLVQLYKVYDLETQIRSMMNALAFNGIIEVQDNLGGTSFKRVNRNEIAKTLISLRKDEITLLKNMIDTYRSLTSQPSQVAGDDTQPGYNHPYAHYRPMFTRVLGYGTH
jgi:hypothetical protein